MRGYLSEKSKAPWKGFRQTWESLPRPDPAVPSQFAHPIVRHMEVEIMNIFNLFKGRLPPKLESLQDPLMDVFDSYSRHMRFYKEGQYFDYRSVIPVDVDHTTIYKFQDIYYKLMQLEIEINLSNSQVLFEGIDLPS